MNPGHPMPEPMPICIPSCSYLFPEVRLSTCPALCCHWGTLAKISTATSHGSHGAYPRAVREKGQWPPSSVLAGTFKGKARWPFLGPFQPSHFIRHMQASYISNSSMFQWTYFHYVHRKIFVKHHDLFRCYIPAL